MNIGNDINKFDNSNGTVKDFNEIFPNWKLNMPEEKEVQILEIPVGKQYTRVLEVDGKTFEHLFIGTFKKSHVPVKINKGKYPFPKYEYTVTSKEGNVTKVYHAKDASKLVNIELSKLTRALKKGDVKFNDFFVSKNKVDESYRYLLTKKDNKKVVKTLEEVLQYSEDEPKQLMAELTDRGIVKTTEGLVILDKGWNK